MSIVSIFKMDLGFGLSYHIFVHLDEQGVWITDAFAVPYPTSLRSKLLEKLTEMKRRNKELKEEVRV